MPVERTSYHKPRTKAPDFKARPLGLLGQKVGMTQTHDEKGDLCGVTVVEVGPCVVLQKRTLEKDGYTALQLGFGKTKTKHLGKAMLGHVKKAGGEDKARHLVRELRVDAATLGKYEVGSEVSLKDLGWKPGQLLDISGVTKGKGFQGVMKRYGFQGFNATHGTHEFFRHGGSIGCRKWPGRVIKGRRMNGHMGDRHRTTQNLRIVAVREDDNAVLVAGSVPGAREGYLWVRLAVKAKKPS